MLDAHSLAFADIVLYDYYKDKKSVQEIEIFVRKLLSINPERLKLYVIVRQVCFLLFLLQLLFRTYYFIKIEIKERSMSIIDQRKFSFATIVCLLACKHAFDPFIVANCVIFH